MLHTDNTERRIFLFLQSHPSSFASKLADELARRGAAARRINLCAGDALFWRGRPAESYRGRFGNWENYLRAYIERHQITDILYYGDRRPYHLVAARLARNLGLNAIAYEFGYLRPDWISLERFGMSAFSHFPDDPELIRKIAADFEMPDMERRYPYTKDEEIRNETLYNFASFLLPFAYPFYNADRYYNLLLEYLSGTPRSFFEKRLNRQAQMDIDRLVAEKQLFFLFPLQLQSDYSLRDNASFAHQGEAIELVVKSFAMQAPRDTQLFFKQHPLDNHLENWPRRIKRISSHYGVSERVKMLVGGDLDILLKHAKGCVLINSTVGLHALQALCPVKVLGKAIYDIKGLCHKEKLDTFWTRPHAPNKELIKDFVRALAGTVQIKGNFFTANGQAAAIPEMADRLIKGNINTNGAYIDPPPRLKTP